MTLTIAIRAVVLILGSIVASLAIVAYHHSIALARSQPDAQLSPRVNRLAYIAIFGAGVQSIIGQTILMHRGAPLNWYGAPLIGLWQSILVVWFVQRVRWHRKKEGSS